MKIGKKKQQKNEKAEKNGEGNSGKLFISFDVFSRVRGGQESFKITEKTMKLGRARDSSTEKSNYSSPCFGIFLSFFLFFFIRCLLLSFFRGNPGQKE